MNILGYGNNVHHSRGVGTSRVMKSGMWEHVFTRVDEDKKKRVRTHGKMRAAEPDAAKAFMTFDTAARVAGISTRHFRRLYDGKLMDIKGNFYVARQDLEQWIADRKRLTETES